MDTYKHFLVPDLTTCAKKRPRSLLSDHLHSVVFTTKSTSPVLLHHPPPQPIHTYHPPSTEKATIIHIVRCQNKQREADLFRYIALWPFSHDLDCFCSRVALQLLICDEWQSLAFMAGRVWWQYVVENKAWKDGWWWGY